MFKVKTMKLYWKYFPFISQLEETQIKNRFLKTFQQEICSGVIDAQFYFDIFVFVRHCQYPNNPSFTGTNSKNMWLQIPQPLKT